MADMSLALPHARSTGTDENVDHSHVRLLAALAAVVLAALFVLTATDAGGLVVLWENAHWTVAAIAALALSSIGLRDARGHAVWPRRLLSAGFLIWLFGQLLWNVQVAAAYYAVPAPSDLFYLGSGVPFVAALVMASRAATKGRRRWTTYLDAVSIFLAVVTALVVLFSAHVTEIGSVQAAVLFGYPIVFLAPAGAGLVAALAMAARPATRGIYPVLVAMAINGLAWAIWVGEAVTVDFPPAGSAVNYAWSIGLLIGGYGAATWPGPGLGETGRRRGEAVLGSLPLAAVMLVGVVNVVTTLGPVADKLLDVTVAATIVVVGLRMALAVREQREQAEREREAARREHAALRETRDALEAQQLSEGRYRSLVEAFNRLGEQMLFAADEADLVKSAARALVQLAPSRAGDILTVNPSRDRLSVSLAWGDGAPAEGSLVEVDAPTRCPGIQRGAPYLVEGAGEPWDVVCPTRPTANASVLCVPMLALGEVVGVIHLERPAGSSFDSDEQRNAARVGEQVALAIANARLVRTMETLALTDALTGLHNARFVDPLLARELSAAERSGRHVAVIMIDLDRFKTFNDQFGHPAGDEALRAFAAVARKCLREADAMARYGGEEFLVVLPDADTAAAAALAERMRRAVEAAVVDVGPGRRAKVTATFGAAGTDIVGYDRTRLLRAADRALYRGKQAGRNRVASASARERHPDWTTHAADSVLRSPQAAD